MDLGKLFRQTERWSEMVAVLNEAENDARESRGPDDSMTLGLGRQLSVAYGLAGQKDLALAKISEVVETARRVFGPDDSRTLSAIEELEGMQPWCGMSCALDERAGNDILSRTIHYFGPRETSQN